MNIKRTRRLARRNRKIFAGLGLILVISLCTLYFFPSRKNIREAQEREQVEAIIERDLLAEEIAGSCRVPPYAVSKDGCCDVKKIRPGQIAFKEFDLTTARDSAVPPVKSGQYFFVQYREKKSGEVRLTRPVRVAPGRRILIDGRGNMILQSCCNAMIPLRPQQASPWLQPPLIETHIPPSIPSIPFSPHIFSPYPEVGITLPLALFPSIQATVKLQPPTSREIPSPVDEPSSGSLFIIGGLLLIVLSIFLWLRPKK